MQYLNGNFDFVWPLDEEQQKQLSSPPIEKPTERKVEWALDKLLQYSIYEFESAGIGSSASDVFAGVFSTASELQIRAQADTNIILEAIQHACPITDPTSYAIIQLHFASCPSSCSAPFTRSRLTHSSLRSSQRPLVCKSWKRLSILRRISRTTATSSDRARKAGDSHAKNVRRVHEA